MLGWKIFLHSFRMVFGNLRQVLQIAVGPAIAATLVILGFLLVLGIPAGALNMSASELPTGVAVGSIGLFTAVMVVVMIATMLWIAVSWHRYILLEEYPAGLFPKFRFDRVLAYLGTAILLGILIAIGFLPMPLVFFILGEELVGVSIILLFFYSLFMLVAFYRLSIVLPASAIGKPIKFREAWNRTPGNGGAFLVLALVMFVFQALVQTLIYLLGVIPVLGALASTFFGALIWPMINVSILTTMYGVFVEGRELT